MKYYLAPMEGITGYINTYNCLMKREMQYLEWKNYGDIWFTYFQIIKNMLKK